jgi:hypothetical protein
VNILSILKETVYLFDYAIRLYSFSHLSSILPDIPAISFIPVIPPILAIPFFSSFFVLVVYVRGGGAIDAGGAYDVGAAESCLKRERERERNGDRGKPLLFHFKPV